MIIGLDLSLTATGIAWCNDDDHATTTLRPPSKMRGGERLHWIIGQIARRGLFEADMVLVEELPTYGQHGNTATKMAELHGVVKYEMFRQCGRTPTMVIASQLKTLATGAGNSKKVAVLIAARERLRYQGDDDNQADALWLLQLGLHHVGHPAAVKLPASHMRALDKVAWT